MMKANGEPFLMRLGTSPIFGKTQKQRWIQINCECVYILKDKRYDLLDSLGWWKQGIIRGKEKTIPILAL